MWFSIMWPLRRLSPATLTVIPSLFLSRFYIFFLLETHPKWLSRNLIWISGEEENFIPKENISKIHETREKLISPQIHHDKRAHLLIPEKILQPLNYIHITRYSVHDFEQGIFSCYSEEQRAMVPSGDLVLHKNKAQKKH